MIQLNLPQYSFRIRQGEKGNQIFDSIRKKFGSLTPEEWVRQHFIRFLVEETKYPASLIAVETGLRYNKLKKRCDITVFNRKGEIWMLVECKAPEVKISQETFNQVATYNAGGKERTKFLAVTNGLKHYCCEMTEKSGLSEDTNPGYHFLKDFPEF